MREDVGKPITALVGRRRVGRGCNLSRRGSYSMGCCSYISRCRGFPRTCRRRLTRQLSALRVSLAERQLLSRTAGVVNVFWNGPWLQLAVNREIQPVGERLRCDIGPGCGLDENLDRAT